MRIVLILIGFVMAASSAAPYTLDGYIEGDAAGEQFGSALCRLDFNFDGFPDLAVSSPAADDNGLSSGKVYIFYGGPDADFTADITLVGDPSSFFGQALASAGDFNSDGAEDLLVGAPYYDLPYTSAGAVYLFYGGENPDTQVDHIFTGEHMSDYFGTAVAGVGDVNGDQYDDIAIGAYKADWGFYLDAGQVYVYFGGPSDDFFVDRILRGGDDGERFGAAITGGDFNADGASDIAVGAYSFDELYLNQGRVYIFHGNPLDTIVDLTITGDDAGFKFGWHLDHGRVTDDGYTDLVMGTDGVMVDTFDAGMVFLFAGGPAMDGIADYSFGLARPESDLLGEAVSSGIDLNYDTYDEIIAGMPGNSDGDSAAGAALVLSGGSSISLDTTMASTTAREQLGKAVTSWPSYKGATGVVLGAPAYDNFRGRVAIYRVEAPSNNLPPVIEPVDDKRVMPGNTLSFAVSATDPNWTIPSLVAVNLPGSSNFVDMHNGLGSFEWSPSEEDTAIYIVTFIASDGEMADSIDVQITVSAHSACCQGFAGNADCDESNNRDLADITRLIDRVYISERALCCEEAGNVDGSVDGLLTLSDITRLIDHVYISHSATAPCP